MLNLTQINLFKADTFEELADIIAIDSATLSRTVARYNEIASDQKDPDFGKSAFTATSVITTPPFYASPRTWAAHITVGGVVVNPENFQAIDSKDTSIDGLYCVGELTAGYMGVGCSSTRLVAARELTR